MTKYNIRAGRGQTEGYSQSDEVHLVLTEPSVVVVPSTTIFRFNERDQFSTVRHFVLNNGFNFS